MAGVSTLTAVARWQTSKCKRPGSHEATSGEAGEEDGHSPGGCLLSLILIGWAVFDPSVHVGNRGNALLSIPSSADSILMSPLASPFNRNTPVRALGLYCFS